MMARWRPAALRFALTLALLTASTGDVAAQESKPLPRYADDLASCYTVMVSAERLVVIGGYGQEGSEADGGLALAALGLMHTGEITDDPFLPHSVPRLAVDVVLGTQVTIGAAAGVGMSHAEAPGYEYTSSGSSERPESSATTVVVAGRVGFILPVRKGRLALWPRIGVSRAWSSNERERSYGPPVDDQTTLTALNLEMVLALAVNSHFALSFDFASDLALAGSSDVDEYGSELTQERRTHDAVSASFGVMTFF